MISTSAYGTKWYITLFANSVPFATQLRLWDGFLLEGLDFLVVTAVAIIWHFQRELFLSLSSPPLHTQVLTLPHPCRRFHLCQRLVRVDPLPPLVLLLRRIGRRLAPLDPQDAPVERVAGKDEGVEDRVARVRAGRYE
jgi:hypothetical protein